MKIAFDYQIFTSQSYGGVSRYFAALARELALLGEECHVVAPIYRNQYLREFGIGNIHGVGLKRFPPKTGRIFRTINHLLSPILLQNIKPDIIHETYYASLSFEKKQACIVTVYDMIHEKFREQFSDRDKTSLYKQNAIKRSDHIVAISHSTKNDLCEIYDVPSEKVTVAHLGVDNSINRDFSEQGVAAHRPYLLYVGKRKGYKNFLRMLQAVASKKQLFNTFDIVAFGGGAFTVDELALISSIGFREGSVRQGRGDDRELTELYRSASAFVYPSLYEGFGLPALEAMAHDCPVVASNTSSMPEIIGDAGEFFDPYDLESMGDAIERVVFDDGRRVQLIENGRKRIGLFTWKQCALKTRDVYRSVIADRKLK
jgi:glycosyltransferase involved in cell wall biosynthesis